MEQAESPRQPRVSLGTTDSSGSVKRDVRRPLRQRVVVCDMVDENKETAVRQIVHQLGGVREVPHW
jgi:hypothetical protein